MAWSDDFTAAKNAVDAAISAYDEAVADLETAEAESISIIGDYDSLVAHEQQVRRDYAELKHQLAVAAGQRPISSGDIDTIADAIISKRAEIEQAIADAAGARQAAVDAAADVQAKLTIKQSRETELGAAIQELLRVADLGQNL